MKTIPEFDFNLDTEPSQRWKHILDHFQQNPNTLSKLKNNIDIILQQFGYNTIYSMITKSVSGIYSLFNWIMYKEEMQSIADFIDLPLEKVIIMQLIYEVSAACTTFVTKVDNDYTMFRTLDWPMNFLNDLTINLNIKKNGQTIGKATTWAGYVGMITAMSSNGYAIALNYRRTQNFSFNTIINNALNTLKLRWPIGYLIRYTVENNTPYETAISYLKSAELISPCYLTVCHHKKKPMIITRNTTDVAYSISDDFVIQTNIDCDADNPKTVTGFENILYSVERQEYCYKHITNSKNNFQSIKKLFDTFIEFPVINHDTIYLTIMCPINQIYITVLNE
jgi:hypothetical protein